MRVMPTILVCGLVCLATRAFATDVGCDGHVGSDRAGQKCDTGCECANNTCRIVSGLFTRPTLSSGYNLIAKIPAGACNINITELKQSRNYLALRTEDGKYFLNGDWAINWSGEHKAAGTTFHYTRHDTTSHLGESITSKGPLKEAVELLVIYQQPNPGIKYEYMIPVKIALPRTGPGTSKPTMPPPKFQPQSDSQILSRRIGPSADINHLQWRRPMLPGRDSRLANPPENGIVLKHPPFSNRSPPSIINGHGGLTLEKNPWRKPRPPKPDGRLRGPDGSPVRKPFGFGGHQPIPHHARPPADLDPNSAAVNVINAVGPNPMVPSSSEKDAFRYYKWKLAGFSECSQTCAGGTQVMVVSCVKESTLVVVPDIHCDAATKPEAQKVKCNTHPCPPSWVPEEWTPCSATCGEGTQTREVACYQQISPTLHIHVPEAACLVTGPRPPTVQQCKLKPCSNWRVGDWEKCSAECGKGMRRREVRCTQGTNHQLVSDSECVGLEKPVIEEMCDMGPCTDTWFFSDWSKTCSEECGEGVHTRHVVCLQGNGGFVKDERNSSGGEGTCDPSSKPPEERPCERTNPCGGKWFAGPWEPCSATCGNGTQIRDVVCMTSARGQWHAALDIHCEEKEKPPTERGCNEKPCLPEWFVSEWTECSKSCNTGVQSREVTCLDAENQQLSQGCPDNTKPPSRQACNTQECPEVSQDSGCVDTYRSCGLVVQARLCRYQYYRNICCDSCYKM